MFPDAAVVFTIYNEDVVFYNKSQLVKVDEQSYDVNKVALRIKKYINLNDENQHSLSEFYFNTEYELIMIKSLISNNILEFDTKKFSHVHKYIINNKKRFKDSMLLIKKQLH